MKSQVFSIDGKNLKEIELPKIFSMKIRKDIMKKAYESEKTQHPYAPSPEAGRHHSASGIIRHHRHVWKTGYGSGRSRVPRKIIWRRGNQFYWIGAEVSGTRGGRRAHPPKIEHLIAERKINKKEFKIALMSAIAGTASAGELKKHYEKLEKANLGNLPFIVESKIISVKTKELIKSLEKILGSAFAVALPKKKIRSGKGKMRNRKYKKSSGVLIITASNEEIKTKAVESRKIKEIEVTDLYPAGRLAVYTENAVKELEKLEERK